jgi:hypothetical protein
MSDGKEVSNVKAVLAANTLVETKRDQARAAGTVISWAKQHLGDLPVPWNPLTPCSCPNPQYLAECPYIPQF